MIHDKVSPAADFAAIDKLVRNVIGRTGTATLVMVTAVTNAGGVSAVGFVDVQPMVNQVDANGNSLAHGIIHQLPYFRLQGGTNAVILDPQVGDIGLAVICSSDISAVKATKAAANPGSSRRNDLADGIYIGGVLNGVPVQYLAFAAAGITVTTPQAITLNAGTSITMNSPTIFLNGFFTQGGGSYGGTSTFNGNFTIIGNVGVTGTLTNNGKLVGSTHTHTAQGATAVTSAPN
jgi:hypothetical protein